MRGQEGAELADSFSLAAEAAVHDRAIDQCLTGVSTGRIHEIAQLKHPMLLLELPQPGQVAGSEGDATNRGEDVTRHYGKKMKHDTSLRFAT
jgi:hypothetical protein